MGQLTKLVVTLKPLLPLAFVGILLLSLGILAYLFVILRAARKRQALQDGQGGEREAAESPKKPGEAPLKPGISSPPSGELRESFARSIRLLKAHVAGKNYRYEIPWFMAVGEAGAGKTTALRNTGLYLPMGEPYEDGFAQQGCNWWFFDRGVVLDVAGDYVLRADGRTSDEKGWNSLLRQLLRHRPARPIDGVILTIPCTDLLPSLLPGAQGLSGAKEKAELLYKRLWQAQRTLGVCFPVYVLVTKCDQIAGFRSFCSEIPQPLHQDIFGWSSPYALEAGFHPGWVDEAFESLLTSLYQAQSELFTEVREVRDSDGLFLFPSEFQPMLETLRVFLNHLFRQSVYHESFFFRGLYFCGDGQTRRAGPPAPAPSAGDEERDPASLIEAGASPLPPAWNPPEAAAPKPSFLKHLFEKKIFPEHGLARPSQQTVFTRNAAMTITQVVLAATLLAGGIGLWRGYGKLKDQMRTLEPLLWGISSDLQKAKAPPSLISEAEKKAHQKKASLDLLRGMATANASRLKSAFFPSTWLSQIHDDIRYSMTLAYDEIILKSIFDALNQRAKGLVGGDVQGAPADTVGSALSRALPPEQLPEFLALQGYVEEVRELERQGGVYNGLRTSRDLGDLSHLVLYLFEMEMTPDFFQNAEYYHSALSQAQYRLFEVTAYRGQAVGHARERVRRLFDRLFERHPLRAYMEEISLQLDDMEQRRGRGGYGADDRFQDLLDTLTEMEAALSGPEVAWVFSPKLNLGPAYLETLETIETCHLLGPDLRSEVESGGERAFQQLREDLVSFETPLTGPILENEAGQLVLSPRVQSLKTVLEDFLGRETAVREAARSFRTEIPPGMRLVWDTGLLEEAVKLSESRLTVGDEFRVFPMSWQNTLKKMASSRLRSRVVDLVAQAQTFEPDLEGGGRVSEEDIRPQVRNFKEAGRPLAALLTLFDRMGFGDAHGDLSDLTVVQASGLLGGVDKLLENEELYEVGDFSVWDGRQSLSSVVFGARDAADMSYYLDVQRERVKYIADEYADPLVTFLGNSRVSRGQVYVPLLSKWQRILSELRKYDNKKPGNSLAALETFILTDIDQIHLGNFSQKLRPPDLAEQSGDFFLQRRNRLRREVYERCAQIAEGQVVTGYTALERFFNQTLAGRFPFVRGGVGAAGEADAEDLREFYRQYDALVNVDREFLKQSKKFAASTGGALEFLYQMEKVRGFLQAFRPGDEKTQIPVLDLEVDFRVNQKYEAGGNQIIDWTLETGDQKARPGDAERRVRWTCGDPVRLTLRWAKDSPLVPAGGGGGGRAEDRTMIYEYVNRWSLLSLMRDHACSPTDFGSLADPKPYTLKFLAETRPAGRGGDKEAAQGEAGQTKVFIRVTPVSPDLKERLVAPAFPDKAPPLNPDKVSRNE